MQRETRAFRASEIRVPDDGSRTFEAVVVAYGVVDDYNTIFDAGCFAESLKTRMPRITWAHSWSDVIGRYVDYKDTDTELTLVGEFDDFESVPRARQAWAQLRSGTIDQFSVGFHRKDGGTYEDDDGITHFSDAGLDEAALVLLGAVPGTKLLAVRSPLSSEPRQVSEDFLIDLARKIDKGDITQAEAHIAIDLAAGQPLAAPDDAGSEEAPPALPDITPEANEALATLGMD